MESKTPAIEDKDLLAGIDVSYSRGRGKGGKRYNYIRPKDNCFNKSRRIGGYTDSELYNQIISCVKKWYYPIMYFVVDNKLIGSNSKENALKEYWMVCERQDIGKHFNVIQNGK